MISILLSLSAYGMLVCMDSIAKHLINFLSVNQIIWGRYFFHFIFTILIILIFKIKINLKKDYKNQVLRSFLLIIGTVFMYIALKELDLVNIFIIYSTSPLFLVLFSIIFLKEKISLLGIILMFLSFLVITYSLEISADFLNIYIIFPILLAISFALYQLVTKKISHNKDPFAAVFYSGLLGSLFFSVYLFLDYKNFTNDFWLYLILIGLLGFFSHLFLILAIQYSNVSFVSYFQYSQLIWASTINVLFFNIDLTNQKIIGIVLIVFFGILFIKKELNN